jgi:hypothetical protein
LTRDDIAPDRPVFRTARPGELGLLTGEVREFGPQLTMAEVVWGTRREFVDIRALDVKRLDESTDMRSRVAAGRYGTVDDLRRRITYEKLQGSLTDIFYSMAAAKIDFLAYQFKPVLSFIDSPTNRLLIADEVGLGKTIEAGLIWTEFQARHHGRRLLVVCPPSLCPKWIRELRERFQIDAVPTDAATLLDWVEEFGRKGAGLRFAGVCSYHALRPTKAEQAYLAERFPDRFRSVQRVNVPNEKIVETQRTRLIERVLEWEETVPFLDMVVFDEAHAMKNTATASHALGDVLSSTSGASLCLSATPIHNESRDLYALLRLIDPDFFNEQYTFDVLRQRNLPVVHLMNCLGNHHCTLDELRTAAAQVTDSDLFDDSPAVRKIRELAASYAGTPEERVELFQQANRLNLLGSFINRTRKVQVMERRVLRVPTELTVGLSSEEKRFYSAVLALIRKTVRERGERVTSFHLLSPALRMSSCIPCIVNDLKQGRWGGFDELELVNEDFEVDADVMHELAKPMDADSLDWIRDYDFEKNDTKYQTLRDDLVSRVREDKIIIFAFFKDTIRYLHRRLTADGFRALAVTGDIQDRDLRDQLLRNFEGDKNQVLLCSEIGAEGIDLQFCRVMVNYDLPWNPMRVEQRIGRIDRIGQRANRITIVNFNMLDTIDGRIYQHLFRKIEIFRSTLGDLEGIIGDEVSKLTTRLLSNDLTPEEETELLEQAADSILSRRKLEAELEDGKEALLAHSDYIAEQIGESHRLGRFVKPEELRMYVSDFFAAHFAGSELNWDTPLAGCGRLKLSFEAWDKLQAFAHHRNQPLPGGSGQRSFYFTFSPERLQELRKRKVSAVLVNHLHPLIQWITEEMGGEAGRLFNTAAVRLVSKDLRAGMYFFLVRRLTLEGLLSKRETLHYAALDLNVSLFMTDTQAEELLNATFEHGRTRFGGEIPDCSGALATLEAAVDQRCGLAAQDYRDEMAAKLDIKRAKVAAHFGRRLNDARRRLATMRGAVQDRVQGIRLTEAQVAHLEEALAKELAAIDHAPDMTVTMDKVIGGVLEVVGA